MTHKHYSEMWFDLPWKNFQKDTFQLQKRIYEASKNNNLAKVIHLQKCLFTSYAARMIAIRQVTQLNSGAKTAGIDNQASLTMKQRFELQEELKQHSQKWKHNGLRQIKIPKSDGTQRILKIPTIRDRAWQCLVKITLEPAHEAEWHSRSYGFRPGRCSHDAQKVIFCNLNSKSNGIQKRVMLLNIKKCFDRISHKTILEKVLAPQTIKTGLLKCLKAGVDIEFPDQGTPQGGVISPLLANIALNGIEKLHPSIRYANHMIFFLKPKHNAEAILENINCFLQKRKMKINIEKIQIIATTKGFNFLGWFFIVQSNGKFRCYPSQKNYFNLKKKVQAVVRNSAYGAKIKSAKISPIVRGWRNYHRYCDMSKHNLRSLNHATWKRFIKEPTINRDKASELISVSFPAVKYAVNGFVNVRQDKSPYDGDVTYWSKRNSELYNGLTVAVLKKQSHICKYCGLAFLGDQQVHLHHPDSNHINWKPKNLIAVHHACHIMAHHK